MTNQDPPYPAWLSGRDTEQRALGNAIQVLSVIAGIVKQARTEPRKDAWRSIDAIASLLDEVTG